MFGVQGSAATTRKVNTSHIYEYTYEYDTQGRLSKSVYTSSSTSSDPEDRAVITTRISYEYGYSADGLPETIKGYDEKGLIGLKKLVCAK